MPVSYVLDEETESVGVSLRGRVELEPMAAAYAEIYQASSSWSRLNELADLRFAETMAISVQDIRQFGEQVAANHAKLGLAGRKVLVTPDDYVFGLGRIFSTHAGFNNPLEVTVVRTIDEAAEWLDRDICAVHALAKAAHEGRSLVFK